MSVEKAWKPTPKQEAFCQSYARYSNATRAAREAGYSQKTAHSIGHELLTKPEIMELVETIRQARFREHHASADEVLAELGKLSRSNLGDVLHITPQGEPYVDLSEATPEFLACLSEAVIEDYMDGRGDDAREVRRVKIKLHSKLDALKALAKHHGLLVDRHEVTLNGDFTGKMAQARERLRRARERKDD